ncbi:hypothetical protein DO64_5383 [Burkholderia pseudomallei]|nr:hypothetical protein DO64_5383 [Burkholderia pseudomallei]KGX57101.1 hypothetical protein Y025_3706 [Burkholderia pseudomallei TSV32]
MDCFLIFCLDEGSAWSFHLLFLGASKKRLVIAR